MKYDLIYSKNALNELEKLDNKIRTRIMSGLERIRIRPESFVRKLVGLPYYRLRIGDYRIILDIDQGKLIILVIKVGHRKNIYKEL